MTHYQKLIQSIDSTYDPRWIEAFMRVEHGTLSHLSREQVEEEIAIFKFGFTPDHAQLWEDVAQSYGL